LLLQAAKEGEDDTPLLGILGGVEGGHLAGLLELEPLVHEERGVAAVVDDEVGPGAVGPHERLVGAPPVLLERLALPGEDGCPPTGAPRRSSSSPAVEPLEGARPPRRGGEERWSLGLRGRRERRDAHALEARGAEPAGHPCAAESEPHVAHRLLVLAPVVLE